MSDNLVANNWRNLIRPKFLEVEAESHTESYGKFVAKPLERGFGITLGNALRRVLLSSVQGAAVTSVKIDGVLHEFSSVEGIKEDVVDIILNLKDLRIKLHGVNEEIIRIEASGAKEVTAADIQANHNVEILNPDLHIATLNEDGKLNMEMTVKMGKGYATANENKEGEEAIGVIPIDSIFSPVKRVNYTVTNARVGQSTDYDRLTLEVITDGSVLPEDAVAFAAKIIKEQISLFVNFVEEPEPVEEIITEEKPRFNENLNRRVDELELSVRSANCLQNANIKYIGELCIRSEGEMLRTKNFGRKSLNEIKEILTEMGLSLGMKVPGWEPPSQSMAPSAGPSSEPFKSSDD